MKKAYNKDIWRAIWKGKKRFFSIMLITTLGVAMFSALKVACEDLKQSADAFLDEQNLFDIQVVSTLGMTDADVDALQTLEEVEQAEGVYSETVNIKMGEKNRSVSIKTLSENGMNRPYLLEGELPQNPDEIAVTFGFSEETAIRVGDTVAIEEDVEDEKDATFLYTEYKVTGIVIDPLDLNNAEGAVSFRTSATEEDTLFVRPEAVRNDIYTVVYLKLVNGKEMFCYGDDYKNYVAEVTEKIENQIKEQREQARYEEVTGEAYEELADAEQEAADEFAKAEEELQEAAEELANGKEEIADGERELRKKEQEAAEGFADAREQLADGKAQLESGRWQLEDARKQLTDSEWQLFQAKQALTEKESEAYAQIAEGRAELTTQLAEVQSQKAALEIQVTMVADMLGTLWTQTEWNAYVQVATDAYIPVIEAQTRGEDSSVAEGAVPDAVSDEETAFLTVFSTSVATAKEGIDYQIAALNPAAADYAEQVVALEMQKNQLDALPSQVQQMAHGLGKLQATELVLNAQMVLLDQQEQTAKEQFAAAWQEIGDGEAELAYGRKQLEEGKGALAYNELQLADGEAELAEKETEAKRQISEGWQEIEDGKQELADGEAELADGIAEYEEKKAEVEQELADAREKIEDIDMTQWYVQDRTSLSGYANVQSDADSIEALGTVFPMVFFVVAILISLTTITRMVEEDRGLIGTYKALGFTDREIRRKYLLYAFAASSLGSVLGNLFGFIVLPGIIFVIFRTMYVLPAYAFQFDALYGIAGPVVFVDGIVCATAIACKAELLQMPAVLMRPKAPRSGSRVLLERITPVWNRLSFLNKVTARNLFRYKKRLLMTIAGIMGCMALLLFGFAVKDSVTDLMPRQYEQVYRYDVMAAAVACDNEKLLSYIENRKEVASYLNVQVETVKLKNGQEGEEKVQLYVVPEDAEFTEYIYLEDLDGEAVTLSDGDIYVTRNASEVLKFAVGDTVLLQRINLAQSECKVTSIVKNYLGNNVYMTQATYEKLFGEYEPNGVLLKLSEECADQQEYAKELSEKEEVVSCMSTEELKAEFSQAFALINMVVYIVIIMAACLAFVVLFTLSTTNISERQRELATIKVLGFYDREVHLYVNKETMILTGVGILCGIPLGYAFAQTLTGILRIPSMYLAVSLHPQSYLMAAGMSFVFALIVNVITNRSLDVIDPVEALKSIG